MIIETVSVIFTLPGNDVCNPRQLTSEANQHTCGGCIELKRELNIEKVIVIEEKRRNYTDAIF